MTTLQPSDWERAIGRAPADEYAFRESTPHLLVIESRSTQIRAAIALPPLSNKYPCEALELAIRGGHSGNVTPSIALNALNQRMSGPQTKIRLLVEIAGERDVPINHQLFSSRCPIDEADPSGTVTAVTLGISVEPTLISCGVTRDEVDLLVTGLIDNSAAQNEAAADAARWLFMDMKTECGLAIREWAWRSVLPWNLLWTCRHLSNAVEDSSLTMERISPRRRSDLAHGLSRFATRAISMAALYHGHFGDELRNEAERLRDVAESAKST